jgi:hypothetical protein
MQRFLAAMFVMFIALIMANSLRADDAAVNAVLDKAIKALGGEARLGKLEAYSTRSKGTITFGGNENQLVAETTIAGIDRFRQEFEVESQGNQFKGVVILNGDKGWRKRVGDNTVELDADAVANEKRSVYMQVIPGTILPLKTKAFKVETAGDETVAGKPAAVLKVTGPEGKTFTLAFDKESGLPVRLVAKVIGFQGAEFTQETTYGDFADFNGIKRPKRIETRRNGEPFGNLGLIEFKVIEKVDPKIFEKPE